MDGFKESFAEPRYKDTTIVHRQNSLPNPSLARNKGVSTGPGMCNNTSQLIIAVEDNPIRTRGTTVVDLSIAHDRPLIVGA